MARATTYLSLLTLCLLAGGARGLIDFSFNHGVASGDPLPTRIIIWTRVTPRTTLAPPRNLTVPVTWEVSRFPDFDEIITEGELTTDGAVDWTVKVDVQNLQPGKRYYYRFTAGAAVSPTGKFKLPLPAGQAMDRIRYAVFGCSAHGFAYFNPYDFTSRYEDLDFWLHLGDFIYEYARVALEPRIYVRNDFDYVPDAPTKPSRDNVTDHFDDLTIAGEIFDLEDYRARYSSYRREPGLQALAAAAPMIPIWDDHEFADNTWPNGSRNHNTELEGDFEKRKFAALQAWHEWQPIRTIHEETGENRGFNIFRSFEFGDLARLVMLENRMIARTNSNPTADTPFVKFSDEASSVFGPILDIIGDTPISEWKESGVEERLLEYKDTLDTFRRRPDGRIIGDMQIQFLKDEIQKMVDTSTKWLLVGQQQVVEDLFWFDHEGAITKKREEGDVVKAAMWQQVFDNALGLNAGAEICSHRTYTHGHRSDYLTCAPVDDATKNATRATHAAGKYRINYLYDGWQGYLDERDRLFEALEGAGGNAVFYASDMHQAYAGTIRKGEIGSPDKETLAAEFTVATTSWGAEGAVSWAPMDFNDAAQVAASEDLQWAATNGKGTFVTTLTKDKHHVDYIFFSSMGTMNYQPLCAKSLEYFSSEKLEEVGVDPKNNRLVDGKCLPFPEGAPYEYMVQNFGVKLVNPNLRDISD